MILLLDFATAFDSLSWKFMHTVLELFNFGPNIMQWIKMFYTNIVSNMYTCSVWEKMASVCRCIGGRGLVYIILLYTYMLVCTIDVLGNNHPHLCVCMSKLWQHKHYPLTCIYIWSPKYYEYQLFIKKKRKSIRCNKPGNKPCNHFILFIPFVVLGLIMFVLFYFFFKI